MTLWLVGWVVSCEKWLTGPWQAGGTILSSFPSLLHCSTEKQVISCLIKCNTDISCTVFPPPTLKYVNYNHQIYSKNSRKLRCQDFVVSLGQCVKMSQKPCYQKKKVAVLGFADFAILWQKTLVHMSMWKCLPSLPEIGCMWINRAHLMSTPP